MRLATRAWLVKHGIRFLLTPAARRVRLQLETDGRQISFLLVTLHALGYAVHVVGSPMVFRDLLALRRSTRIPFIIGGSIRACGLAICDTEAALARGQEPRKVLLSYHFFNLDQTAPRMPYFMHPMIYAKGLHRLPSPRQDNSRPIRIGFFGSRDADFYTRHFHFPILNREEILTTFLNEFGNRIWVVDAPVASWGTHEIAVAIDGKGGDSGNKAFLPLPDYLQALRKCNFFLSPPGWCMPVSHNLIEAMMCGAIPILNHPESLDPPLRHGVNCLAFKDIPGLKAQIRAALEMPPEQIAGMRREVSGYYDRFLAPSSFGMVFCSSNCDALLVNAEEKSVPLAYPQFVWPPES